MSCTFASAARTACGNENISVKLQRIRGVQSFPSRCYFNQHAFARNFALLVKLNQPSSFFNRSFNVERKSRVGLSRNAPRDNLKNVGAELDEQMIANVLDL